MVYAIATQKGGTGKTTTAAALAQAAASAGKTTLAIDLDPQCNLTFALSADPGRPGSYGLLEGADPAHVIQGTAQGMDVAAASPDLAAIRSARGSARRLQEAIKGIRRLYDMIIIDTPPTAGDLQYNALQAADGLIIPLQADIYGTHSLDHIADTARQMRQSNPYLKITGIVITQYDRRGKLSRAMYDAIKAKAEGAGIPFLGAVRQGIAIKEAQALQVSLFDYAPKSNPARDYLDIFNRLTEQEG